jgi:hypothetical protein
MSSDDEIHIVLDSINGTPESKLIIENFITNCSDKKINFISTPLNGDYSLYKNTARDLANAFSLKNSNKISDYVFQIDADEIPTDFLLTNLKDVLSGNPEVDLFWVPRVNDFKGVTEKDAIIWHWTLSEYDGKKIVNFPDYQSRIFKNIISLKWERKLHERVVGAKVFTNIPADPEWSLIHTKTIEKQRATNIRYNTQFTENENRGV